MKTKTKKEIKGERKKYWPVAPGKCSALPGFTYQYLNGTEMGTMEMYLYSFVVKLGLNKSNSWWKSNKRLCKYPST